MCVQGTTILSPSQPRTQLFSSGYQLHGPQEKTETLTGGQLGQGHTAGVRKSPQRNLGLVLSSKPQ